MLSLLSHILHTGSINVLSRSHRRNLDSSIGNALSSDELLIKLSLCGALLHDLNDWLVLSESSNDIEILGLDDVILLCL